MKGSGQHHGQRMHQEPLTMVLLPLGAWWMATYGGAALGQREGGSWPHTEWSPATKPPVLGNGFDSQGETAGCVGRVNVLF